MKTLAKFSHGRGHNLVGNQPGLVILKQYLTHTIMHLLSNITNLNSVVSPYQHNKPALDKFVQDHPTTVSTQFSGHRPLET